jgi:hypothetical protein
VRRRTYSQRQLYWSCCSCRGLAEHHGFALPGQGNTCHVNYADPVVPAEAWLSATASLCRYKGTRVMPIILILLFLPRLGWALPGQGNMCHANYSDPVVPAEAWLSSAGTREHVSCQLCWSCCSCRGLAQRHGFALPGQGNTCHANYRISGAHRSHPPSAHRDVVPNCLTVRPHISQESNPRNHRRDNLKSHLQMQTMNIVTWRLKAGIVESEEMSVVRKRLGEYISVATNKQATIELPFLYNGEVGTSL